MPKHIASTTASRHTCWPSIAWPSPSASAGFTPRRFKHGAGAALEPRWPGFLALLAGAGLHYSLPPRLSVGPDWLMTVVMVLLLVPIIVSHRWGWDEVARWLTFVAVGALSLGMVASLVLLIAGLPHHKDTPGTLLRSAAVLWATNVLVFALWYWKLDAGGPLGRDRATRPVRSSFLFPQMAKNPPDMQWSPEFLDYLFLAFNTSTAFSPTDSAVLDRWAKVLMMLQAAMSLSILAILGARAINIL